MHVDAWERRRSGFQSGFLFCLKPQKDLLQRRLNCRKAKFWTKFSPPLHLLSLCVQKYLINRLSIVHCSREIFSLSLYWLWLVLIKQGQRVLYELKLWRFPLMMTLNCLTFSFLLFGGTSENDWTAKRLTLFFKYSSNERTADIILQIRVTLSLFVHKSKLLGSKEDCQLRQSSHRSKFTI